MRNLILASALMLSTALVPLFAPEETLTKESKEHPRIHEAMVQLEQVIKELKEAPHDFNGHKADAMEACHKARHQLRLALGYRVEADGKEKERR